MPPATRIRGTQIADNTVTAADIDYTLDEAYDNSGSGLGRTIIADSGPVIIDGTASAIALEVTGSLVVTGPLDAKTQLTASNFLTNNSFRLGTQTFYPQTSNGFSVNENFDASNSATQTAYHFTSGDSNKSIVFDLAVTNRYTTMFGTSGSSGDNIFVIGSETAASDFYFKSGLGIRPINLSGGTTLAKVTRNGDFEVTRNITASGTLRSEHSSGADGGEIFLNKAVTNTNLSKGVTIDVYQNRVRIFETEGTNRGGFFDISSLETGANSDLYLGKNIPLSFLGDASDGSVVLDSTVSVAWATRAGSVYTMTRDAYVRDLTINAGVTLRQQGFQPFVKGILMVSGTYEAKGNDATGGAGGALVSNLGSWSYNGGGGGAGGGPTTGNAAGSNGSGAGSNSIGGAGGNGGGAGVQAGGNGNSTVTPVAAVTGWRDVGFFVRRRVFNVAAAQAINSSGGGGGGAVAGDGVNSGTGGGGGGAGLNCYVICNVLNNIGTIRSLGGNGSNGTSAGGTTRAGGGGGGAGGGVIVAANYVRSLGTIVSTGGAFGNGANGGGNGNAGTAGTVLILTGS